MIPVIIAAAARLAPMLARGAGAAAGEGGMMSKVGNVAGMIPSGGGRANNEPRKPNFDIGIAGGGDLSATMDFKQPTA